MSVLTLAGKPIDWAHPPAPTTKVMWSQRTTGGKPVTGSLRTIAHLDHLSTLAIKRYRVGVSVIQPPFNTGVKVSEGTHDLDACSDVRIVGVPWEEQQRFFRANGAGAYYRKPPTFTPHIHMFTLPPHEGDNPSDDFRVAGFKVGMYVDGGWSLHGKVIASSQIADYYNHRNALSGHAYDPSWFPPNIAATVFNLPAYIKRQQASLKPKPQTRLRVAMINIPNKVGRAAWITCWKRAADRGAIFGVNESFHKAQRATYAALVTASKGRVAQYGLRSTPNPVFWRTARFKKVSGKVHRLHPRNTSAVNAKKWPGFYDARYVTEVVLRQKRDGREFAVLNTHLAAEVKVIDQNWLADVKDKSYGTLRDLIRKHQAAGREVILMGDMNTNTQFSTPRGMRWHTPAQIDKIGSTLEGSAGNFDAPTDHKHGSAATLRL